MIPLVFVTAALAAPAGWTASKSGGDCQLYTGPSANGDIPPVRAECHWPEVTPQKVVDLLAKWDKHDEYHASIVTADVLRTENGRTLVRQTHQASGISDRQVTVWASQEPVDGGTRLSWTMAGADQGALLDDHVAVVADDGSWTITDDPAGGTFAVYVLSYDPGGSVPGFVVRWFQGAGVIALAGELRALAAK